MDEKEIIRRIGEVMSPSAEAVEAMCETGLSLVRFDEGPATFTWSPIAPADFYAPSPVLTPPCGDK